MTATVYRRRAVINKVSGVFRI